MEQITKNSAGCIVIDPETEKILLTNRLSKIQIKADIMKALIKLFRISPEKALAIAKASFTKGKIEPGDTVVGTALRETEEEAGIKQDLITIKKHLWSFTKKKRYGQKKIDMFLGTVKERCENPEPLEHNHIAARIDIKKAPRIMKSDEEREFLESASVQEAIAETLIAEIALEDLSLETVKDELEVDVGVEG